MRATVVTLAVVLTALSAVPALAQDVNIRTTPPKPAPEPGIVTPGGDHYDTTRPSDADNYPQSPRVRYQPAFVGPLSSKTETGRVGVAGWTSPNTPVGSRQLWNQIDGWFGIGIAVEWGGPPASRPPAR